MKQFHKYIAIIQETVALLATDVLVAVRQR